MRQTKGIGLRELARRTGVTPGFVSQLENGMTRPSVDTLFRLAQALGTSTDAFFVGPAEQDRPRLATLRSAERPRIELDQGIVWERLVPGDEAGFQLMEVTFPPGAVSSPAPQRHPGRDYLVLLQGQLTVELGSERIILDPGDSVAFDASIPHRLINQASGPSRAISVILDAGVLRRAGDIGGRVDGDGGADPG